MSFSARSPFWTKKSFPLVFLSMSPHVTPRHPQFSRHGPKGSRKIENPLDKLNSFEVFFAPRPHPLESPEDFSRFLCQTLFDQRPNFVEIQKSQSNDFYIIRVRAKNSVFSKRYTPPFPQNLPKLPAPPAKCLRVKTHVTFPPTTKLTSDF